MISFSQIRDQQKLKTLMSLVILPRLQNEEIESGMAMVSLGPMAAVELEHASPKHHSAWLLLDLAFSNILPLTVL